MAQQKLYTEEDVLKMLRSFHTLEMNVQLSMYKLTSIELPSDDEIGKGRDENIPIDEKDMWSERFYFTVGAKWMKEQILNQNK